jgi:putative flippase GtrA
LLPHVADTGWFFDTELLVLAERSGLRIHEVPVDWVDDPDSRVDIVATAKADLKGIVRLLKGFATGAIPVNTVAAQLGSSRTAAAPGSLLRQVVRFASVGVASTIAYLALFVLLHGLLGAQVANLAALLATTIANTAANRRFTFGVHGHFGAVRHQIEGIAVFAIALGITSGALAGLHGVAGEPQRWIEIVVLVLANLAATAVRFVLLRGWVFHPRRSR